jgi:hypothetical protein
MAPGSRLHILQRWFKVKIVQTGFLARGAGWDRTGRAPVGAGGPHHACNTHDKQITTTKTELSLLGFDTFADHPT